MHSFSILNSLYNYAHSHFNRSPKWKHKLPKKNSYILLKNVIFEASFPWWNKALFTFMPIACFIYWLFILNAFSFSSLVVAYVCTFLACRGSKWTHKSTKNQSFFTKENVFFWSLFSNCLFCILNIYHKCLFLQFLGCGISMHIPILTGVQNGQISSWKNGYNLL